MVSLMNLGAQDHHLHQSTAAGAWQLQGTKPQVPPTTAEQPGLGYRS